MRDLKPGMNGEDVKLVQAQLMQLGFPLPRFGADGWCGTETLEAFSLFAATHLRVVEDETPGVISVVEQQALFEVYDRALGAQALPSIDGHVFDSREQSSRQWDRGPRLWRNISAIVLHQTACYLGENPARMLTVGAHAVATRDGNLHLLHGLDRRIVHANGFNAGGAGIEIDGWYEGVKGRPETLWQPKDGARRVAMKASPAQIKAALAWCEWTIDQVDRHGGKIRHVLAHRQSSGQRTSDPGSEPWQLVAIPLIEKYGLQSGPTPDWKIDDGRPIPEAWDPVRHKGIKY